MKQGRGKLYRSDGTIYHGTWDAGLIVGAGKVTITVGDENKKDGLPKQVRLDYSSLKVYKFTQHSIRLH